MSPSLISTVTDAVVDEVKAWQTGPLDPVYPIVYLNCIDVKVREGAVRVKAVYLAIGVTIAGEKEVLGLWLNYVSWKRRLEVAADIKHIYARATAEEAEQRLGEFEAKWDKKYLPIGQSWRRNWPRLIPFFEYPPEIRKVIYTTNAIESLNMVMRKYTRNRRIFPNDEAALKALFLAIGEASKRWKCIHHWKPALQSFQLMFGDERVPLAAL